MMNIDYSKHHYQNDGNIDVLKRILPHHSSVLDVGCGAGDNARILRQARPSVRVVGITASSREATSASQNMAKCIVADIEEGVPKEIQCDRFDCIVFCHVLEHLSEPWRTLAEFEPYLRAGGTCLIAVPNIACFGARWQLLRGRFPYQTSGIFDETHLRFFTYHTAPQLLLRSTTSLVLCEHIVTGSIPLWILRRHLFPKTVSRSLDALGCRLFPNLFGGQIIMSLTKRDAAIT